MHEKKRVDFKHLKYLFLNIFLNLYSKKVLANSKNESKLLQEIKQMEDYLSKLLKQIKICDNLDIFSLENSDYDHSLLNSVSYYNKMLHLILNNLTAGIKVPSCNEIEKILSETKFSHLQLTIQK